MDPDKKNTLPDIQSARDGRNIAIDRVGVRGITVPITVETAQGTLSTVATISMTVSLPADKKGTHMSRFVALIEEHAEPLNADTVRLLMVDMYSASMQSTEQSKCAFLSLFAKAPLSVNSLV